MDFSGLNQTNAALTRFGDTVMQIGFDMKRQEDQRNRALGLLEFHTWATDQTDTLLRELHQRPYSELQTEDGNAGETALSALHNTLAERVRGVKDPDLAINMQRISDGLILDAKNRYLGHFEAKKRDHFLGVYQNFEKQQFDKVISTMSPESRGQEITVYESGVRDLVQSGVMNEATAAKELLTFRNKVDQATAGQLVRGLTLGSKETVESITAKIGALPYLNEDQKSLHLYHLSVQADKLRGQQADQRVSMVNAQLYNDFGGDRSKIINYLSVPENQATLGLTLNEANHLISVNHAQKNYMDNEAKKLKQEAAQKSVNDFYGLVNQGKVGPALDLMKQAASMGIIDQDDLYKARKMLTETPKEPKEPKTDEATWVKALVGIHEGKINTPLDLLKAGVRGDKFAQAMDRIDRNEKGEVKGQFNYLTSSIAKYYVDDKDLSNEQKKQKQNFTRSLDWWMRKEGMTPNDPKVGELADRLMAPVVKSSGYLWNTEQPLADWLAEKKPWVTGQDFQMGGIYDPEMPTATPGEIKQVSDILKTNKLPVTPGTKARALTSVRNGVDISKVGMSGGVPDKARIKIQKILKAQGKVVNESTIQQTWDLHGNKVFEE